MTYLSYDGLNFTDQVSTQTRASYGNFGFTDVFCGKSFINWSPIDDVETKLYLQCEGTTQIEEVYASGVVDMDPLKYANSR